MGWISLLEKLQTVGGGTEESSVLCFLFIHISCLEEDSNIELKEPFYTHKVWCMGQVLRSGKRYLGPQRIFQNHCATPEHFTTKQKKKQKYCQIPEEKIVWQCSFFVHSSLLLCAKGQPSVLWVTFCQAPTPHVPSPWLTHPNWQVELFCFQTLVLS